MASVVDFAPPQPAATPSVHRIRTVSRGFEWLFTGLFVAFIVLALFSLWVVLFYQGSLIAVGPRGGLLTTDPLPPDFVPFRDWRLDQKLAYVPVVLVRAAPTIALFWCLRALFRLYRQSQVFGRPNAGLIKAMGVCLIADALAPAAVHLALSATGYEIDKLWFHPIAGLQETVLGAVVFVIAQVMQAGHEIEQDREGFV